MKSECCLKLNLKKCCMLIYAGYNNLKILLESWETFIIPRTKLLALLCFYSTDKYCVTKLKSRIIT